MSSRDAILGALSSVTRDAPALPSGGLGAIEFEDPATEFIEVLEAVGGRAITVERDRELSEVLHQLPVWSQARRICSLQPGVEGANVDLASVSDPHDLEDLDVAIVPGEFGVAENAAVWVDDRAIPHRAVLFIPQHLVLVLRRDLIVDNMHEAYRRLRFAAPGFGVFISGPSKTADIEQSMVIGAHGPRSLTILVTEAREVD